MSKLKKILKKYNDEKQNNNLKIKKYIYIIIFLIIVCFSSFSFAYLHHTKKINVMETGFYFDSYNQLVFSSGGSLLINASLDNFAQNMGSLSNEMTTSANLKMGVGGESASDYYHIILDVESNNFEYTTSSNEPELVMTITDPDGNLVTTAENLKFVEVLDSKTNEIIKGFDITTTIGATRISSYHDIYTESSTEGTTHDWHIKLTYVNLDAIQNDNSDKKLEADIILTKDITYSAVEPFIEILENDYNPTIYGWVNSDIETLINVDDPNGLGIKETKYCITKNASCEPDIIFTDDTMYKQSIFTKTSQFSLNYKEYDERYTVTLENEGANILCVSAANFLSQITTICSDEYKIDKTNPVAGDIVLTGSMGKNNWYISQVAIEYTTPSDFYSGVESVILSRDLINYSTASEIVTMTIYDKAGNKTIESKEIKVDIVDPVINGAVNQNFQKGDSVNLLSGVTCIDDMTNNCTVSVDENDFSINKAGTYEVTYKAEDEAGNTSEKIVNITVDADMKQI